MKTFLTAALILMALTGGDLGRGKCGTVVVVTHTKTRTN